MHIFARFNRGSVRALACAALLLSATLPGPARADRDYEASEAGNPLRVVYYVAYPVFGLLDVLIFRPAYFLGKCEPFQTIFGVPEHSEDFERADDDRDRDQASTPAADSPTL
jgi:hypothetical protein